MFKKGFSGNPAGKKPGTVHRTTIALKEAFLGVFDKVGGQQALVDYAKKSDENYITVVQMLARLLPREITGPDGEGLTIVIKKVLHDAANRDT